MTTKVWKENTSSSRHRKPQRLAAAAHIDRSEPDRRQPAGAAIALFADLELAVARAQLFRPAPVQRSVPVFDGAVLAVDRFGKTEHLLRLAGHVGVQAFAGIDAIPAAAGHRLAV